MKNISQNTTIQTTHTTTLDTSDIKPLDEFARHILDRSINCEFQIVISDLLLFELSKYINDVNSLLLPLKMKDKLQQVSIQKEDKRFAKNISLHFPDNVHVAIAQRCNCKYFVTNDKEILKSDLKIKIVDSQFFQFC